MRTVSEFILLMPVMTVNSWILFYMDTEFSPVVLLLSSLSIVVCVCTTRSRSSLAWIFLVSDEMDLARHRKGVGMGKTGRNSQVSIKTLERLCFKQLRLVTPIRWNAHCGISRTPFGLGKAKLGRLPRRPGWVIRVSHYNMTEGQHRVCPAINH